MVSSQPHSATGELSAASGHLVYYHFRFNKIDQLILLDLVELFLFCFYFMVQVYFYLYCEFYFGFCGFGTKHKENSFYSFLPEFIFVAHLHIATIFPKQVSDVFHLGSLDKHMTWVTDQASAKSPVALLSFEVLAPYVERR